MTNERSALNFENDNEIIKFWGKNAKSLISWEKPWKTPYLGDGPDSQWFKEGELNLSFNCLDRHLKEIGDNPAIVWIPEPQNENKKILSYRELYDKVVSLASYLKSSGVNKGDVVTIYMPLIPETAISMLACARIGAVHSVVFSAYSVESLEKRIIDSKSKFLITADGYYRRGEEIKLLENVLPILERSGVKNVLFASRLGQKFIQFDSFEKALSSQKNLEDFKIMLSGDPSFILYTSGTTGKPKGIIHDTGGYAVHTSFTSKLVFGLKPGERIWCTADMGWITGHSYAIYGPLLNGATTFIYEGSLDFPDYKRVGRILSDNKINVFYTSPTAIRAMKKYDKGIFEEFDFEDLKIIGSVGEPIDEQTWKWYSENIGKNKCYLVDTWWQTETGGIMICSIPGLDKSIPSVAGKNFPGVKSRIVNASGLEIEENEKGFLLIESPFPPGMLKGIIGDRSRYLDTYWKKFDSRYYSGDGAIKLKDELIKIIGRVDDTIKVAGHLLSSAELENSISKIDYVSECAVVGMPDELKGEVPAAFIVSKMSFDENRLNEDVEKAILIGLGPIAKIRKIFLVEDLPKTRSGKIVRRALKSLIRGEELGDLTTLVNPDSIKKIKRKIDASNNF